MEYRLSRQEGARGIWHAVKHETVDRSTVLACTHFKRVGGAQRCPYVKDFLHIGKDEDRLFDGQN